MELIIELLLNRSQLNLESNIFLSKRNILSTIEFKESKEFQYKDKLSSTKKCTILKESQLKELLLTIMLLKLKSNTSLKKLKKLLSNTNQSKEPGKEFNICQLKLKLFTTQKEKNM